MTLSMLHPLLLKQIWDVSRELQENQSGRLCAFSLSNREMNEDFGLETWCWAGPCIHRQAYKAKQWETVVISQRS